MSIDPRQLGVTPYPQVGGGLFAALALAGQQLAQGLLQRQQIDREKEVYDLQVAREKSEAAQRVPFGELFPDFGTKYPALARLPHSDVARLIAQNPDRFPDLAESFYGIKPDMLNTPVPSEIWGAAAKKYGLPAERVPTWAQFNQIVPGGMARWLATQNSPKIGEVMPQYANSPIANEPMPVDELGRPDLRALEALFRIKGIDPPRTPREVDEAKQNYITRRQTQLEAAVAAGDEAQVIRVAQALTSAGVPTDPRPHIQRARQGAQVRGAQVEVALLQPEQIRAQIAALRADAKRAREAAKNPGLSDQDKAILNEYTQLRSNQAALYSKLSQIDNALDLTPEQKQAAKGEVQAQLDAIQQQVDSLRPRYDAILGIQAPQAPAPTDQSLNDKVAAAAKAGIPWSQVSSALKTDGVDPNKYKAIYDQGVAPTEAPKPIGNRAAEAVGRVVQRGADFGRFAKTVVADARAGRAFPEGALRKAGLNQRQIDRLRTMYNANRKK